MRKTIYYTWEYLTRFSDSNDKNKTCQSYKILLPIHISVFRMRYIIYVKKYCEHLPPEHTLDVVFVACSVSFLSVLFALLLFVFLSSCLLLRWIFFILALWFWNQTCTTRTLKPVSFASASRTCVRKCKLVKYYKKKKIL